MGRWHVKVDLSDVYVLFTFWNGFKASKQRVRPSFMFDIVDMTYTLDGSRELNPYFIINRMAKNRFQYIKLFIFWKNNTDDWHNG